MSDNTNFDGQYFVTDEMLGKALRSFLNVELRAVDLELVRAECADASYSVLVQSLEQELRDLKEKFPAGRSDFAQAQLRLQEAVMWAHSGCLR